MTKDFSGLLDTGSNITIISKHLWPKFWPLQKNFLPNYKNISNQNTRGLSKCPNISI